MNPHFLKARLALQIALVGLQLRNPSKEEIQLEPVVYGGKL